MPILVPGITRRRSRPSGWTPPGGGGTGGDVFGPPQGDTAVRNGTTPQAVTHPGGSPTVVNPTDNIATKITAAGTGGTLWFTKGNYSMTASVAPLAGQTWVLESIVGYTRTSADSVVFNGNNGPLNSLISSSAANVTIRGGVLQNQGDATSATFAAALLHSGGISAGGWLVEDMIIQNNFNVGLKFSAPNCTARRVYMHHNGRYGPNGTEAVSGEQYTGTVIEKCRWAFNNTRELDIGDAAGGSKFLDHPGIIIRECWVHDNTGFGIWCDFVGGNIGGAQYIENVVEHNRRSGMFFEGVTGGCTMLRNYVYNNGYDGTSVSGLAAHVTNCTQVRVTNADSTLGTGVRGLIEGNLFDFDLPQSSALGAALMLWNHDPISTDVKNWTVDANLFRFRATANDFRIGGRDTKTSGTQIWAGNNFFGDANKYEVGSLSSNYWQWGTGSDTGLEATDSWTTWQGFGFDGQGTRILI